MSLDKPDSTVINFEEAKRPHVFSRQNDKIKAIKKAFKASRIDALPKQKKNKKKRKNKKK